MYYPKQSSFKSIGHQRMDAFNGTPNSNFGINTLFEKRFKITHQASLFTRCLVMEGRQEKRSITISKYQKYHDR